jgi:hypothetical protein
MRKLLLGLVLVSMLVGVAALTFAQDAPIPAAENLNAPRHLFVDADGTLYIVEAGFGGETEVDTAVGTELGGTSGQITAVSPEGEQSVFVSGFYSVSNEFAQSNGISAVRLTEDSVWVLHGLGPIGDDRPTDAATMALVQHDRATLEVLQTIDLYAFEEANNPDTRDVDSNPVDFVVAADGSIYIADAGANAVLKWVEGEGLSVFKTWIPDGENPAAVPTSLAIGEDGNLLVSFLTGFPFLTGVSWLEVLDAEVNEIVRVDGLTLVTDLWLAEDGTIYAVEYADGFGDFGFNANTGRIVAIVANTIQPVVTGLNFPYGIADAGDGNFFVSVNSAFTPPGSGQVWQVAPGMELAPAPDPAATEEG